MIVKLCIFYVLKLFYFRCGGGKTAVFIAIDFCLKQLEVEKFVDIYSTVLYLRKFRQNMVRTLVSKQKIHTYSLYHRVLVNLLIQFWI